MLNGAVKPIKEYTESEVNTMYHIMEQFYDNTDREVFLRDFYDKDYCLALRLDSGEIVGFTTAKLLRFTVDGREINGIFSGDTIIHKSYWGEPELFKVWANFWFSYAEKYEEFYWFLICKGYKTYRIMPLFWTEYYPCYKCDTPEYEKKITDTYATLLYPDEYNPKTGVIEYKKTKDKLKIGVADIGEHELKNKDTAFFCKANPDYIKGNDLACLAKIDKSVLKTRLMERLFK